MKLYNRRALIVGMLLVSYTLCIQSLHADLLGQIDTFDSDLMGWIKGAEPGYVSSGGPLGSGDSFLQISRTASFPFHLGVINKAQWTGNYLAAGVTAIEVDLNVLAGLNPLNIRLMLWGDGGVWASSITTPVSAGWNHYVFGLTAADMVFVDDDTNSPVGTGGGTGVLADTLQNVNIVQIRHDRSSPTLPGAHPPHIVGTLGIDNFEAVPEPGSLGYMLAALGCALVARNKKRRVKLFHPKPDHLSRNLEF